MPMSNNGLTKLIEESGEVTQVAAKLIAYPELQDEHSLQRHPDGTFLRDRLEEELADFIAAANFVIRKMKLNQRVIQIRSEHKIRTFTQWDQE